MRYHVHKFEALLASQTSTSLMQMAINNLLEFFLSFPTFLDLFGLITSLFILSFMPHVGPTNLCVNSNSDLAIQGSTHVQLPQLSFK